MLIIFEVSSPVSWKAFFFEAPFDRGYNYRFGWLFFAVSVVTKTDYFRYHEYIQGGDTVLIKD